MMKFTRRTYRRAITLSECEEQRLWKLGYRDAYMRQYIHTTRLIVRQSLETR